MPIYDYRCRSCGGTYDVLHKVREVAEDIRCPSCGSQEHVRLISAPAVRVASGSAAVAPSVAAPSCCRGGSCDVN